MADKSAQVVPLMRKCRDILQQELCKIEGLQEICTEMKQLNVQLITGITLFARDLDGGNLVIPDEETERMIPEKLSMEGEGADWLRQMRITLDDTRPEDSMELHADGVKQIEVRNIGGRERCACNGPGCPTCSPRTHPQLNARANQPIDPGHHYHVIVETLPERLVLGIETCSTEIHALNVMASWNQREDRIASMPLRPCHGDCPQVDR